MRLNENALEPEFRSFGGKPEQRGAGARRIHRAVRKEALQGAQIPTQRQPSRRTERGILRRCLFERKISKRGPRRLRQICSVRRDIVVSDIQLTPVAMREVWYEGKAVQEGKVCVEKECDGSRELAIDGARQWGQKRDQTGVNVVPVERTVDRVCGREWPIFRGPTWQRNPARAGCDGRDYKCADRCVEPNEQDRRHAHANPTVRPRWKGEASDQQDNEEEDPADLCEQGQD